MTENIVQLVAEKERRSRASAGGAGEPPSSTLETRITYLEKHFDKIDSKLDKIVAYSALADVKLATIDVKLDGKASTMDVGKLETRVATIDTKLDSKAAQSDLSEIKGKSDKFVDKWFVLKTCLWSIGATSTFIAGITLMQNKIRFWLGVQ